MSTKICTCSVAGLEPQSYLLIGAGALSFLLFLLVVLRAGKKFKGKTKIAAHSLHFNIYLGIATFGDIFSLDAKHFGVGKNCQIRPYILNFYNCLTSKMRTYLF